MRKELSFWRPGDVAVDAAGQRFVVVQVDDHPLEYSQLLVKIPDEQSVCLPAPPPFWISSRMLIRERTHEEE